MSQTIQAKPGEFPLGKRVKIEGAELKCYTIPEYKKLMGLYVDLNTCTAKEVLLKQKIANLEKQAAIYNEIADLHLSSIKILTEENKRLFGLWKEENKKRHIAENKPQFGSWLSWGSAGVLAAASAVLLTVILLDD